MPTIVSVGAITIVDVNDGAPGPAVVVTGNRPLNFTATDGVLDSAQPNIVLTAEVFGLASTAYVWTFLGFETSPVSSGTSVQTITMAQFGTSRAASVTCTVNGLYVSQVTIVRAERSTAEAWATVGADDSNYTGGRGNNLLRNSMLKDSTAGWGYALGSGCTLGEFRTALNENGAPKGYGALKLGFSGTASSVYESQVYCGDLAVPCIPGERMELGARVGVHRGDAQLTASFLLADGSFTLYVPVTGGVSEATSQSAWTQSLSDLQHLWGFVTAPANAVKCYMEVRVKRTTTAAATDLYIALPYIGKAGAAQAVYSPWNQGVFITPSEVTTWIANAALGNAQIGGDIWSNNHVAGSAGWRIYRSGNAEFRNVTARGDIEASSLKAGVAMIDALNLKGSALIIPIQISYGAKSINLPYVQGEWHSGEALRYTLSLAHGGLFKFSFAGSFYINHWTGHANYGYGYQTKSVELWINNVRVDYLATNLPDGASSPLSANQIPERFYWLGPGNHTISIRMWALMADGGAAVGCSAGSLSIQSFSTVASDV